MSFMLTPSVAGRVLTQLGNASSWFRGVVRVNSEGFGMPRTVPNNRKMDYAWRDLYMPWANAYVMEMTYRMAEQMYVSPHFKEVMAFDKLGIQGIPGSISSRMMGSLVNPRSYYTVPDLLESQEIPALQKRLQKMTLKSPGNHTGLLALRKEITQTRLLANHLRSIVNPEQYIDKGLAGPLTKQEATLLKSHLKMVDKLAGLFSKSNETQMLHPNLARILKTTMPLAERHKLMEEARKAPLQQLVRKLKVLALQPGLKDSAYLKELTSLTDEQLVRRLYGHSLKSIVREVRQSGFINGAKLVLGFTLEKPGGQQTNLYRMLKTFATHKRYTPEKVLAELNEHIMLPIFKANHAKADPKVFKILQELAGNKAKLAKLTKVFDGSGFWLKLPLSIFGVFLMYGLLANTFDNKFIQPYQREITKKIGDTKDVIAPAFVGIIPGGIVFSLLNRIPQIQKLGYIGSFAVAGFGGLAAFFATAASLFHIRIAKRQSAQAASGQPFTKPDGKPHFAAAGPNARPFPVAGNPMFATASKTSS